MQPDNAGIGDGAFLFRKNGFLIQVVFIKGVAQRESFFKADNSDIPANEVATILKADSSGSHWSLREENGQTGPEEIFICDNGSRAIYNLSDHELEIISQEYLNALHAKKDADEQNKLKGF